VVARVLRLIDEGALEASSVEELAARVGMGARHLRRLLVAQVGSPPRALKRARPARRLRLRCRAPYDWASLSGFLAARAVPGLESLEDGVYRRAVAFGEARGVIEVRPHGGGAAFELCAPKALQRHLMPIVERVRRLLDLDADPAVIDAHLRRDRRLARRVAARPGLRVPGAWDPFELGVRAILGQQISVRGATTLAGRLVATYGEASGDVALPRLFPRPEALAHARLESIGLPRARAEALRAFAARGTLDGVRGVGPWTRAYVALRSGDPDAFPAADLGVLRALGVDTPAQAERRAAAWRPWRAYAVLHLWMEPC
jgi:AraC family transcriptional regulator of adaptative response / DNA-3-methyladenine glycosylase II